MISAGLELIGAVVVWLVLLTVAALTVSKLAVRSDRINEDKAVGMTILIYTLATSFLIGHVFF